MKLSLKYFRLSILFAVTLALSARAIDLNQFSMLECELAWQGVESNSTSRIRLLFSDQFLHQIDGATIGNSALVMREFFSLDVAHQAVRLKYLMENDRPRLVRLLRLFQNAPDRTLANRAAFHEVIDFLLTYERSLGQRELDMAEVLLAHFQQYTNPSSEASKRLKPADWQELATLIGPDIDPRLEKAILEDRFRGGGMLDDLFRNPLYRKKAISLAIRRQKYWPPGVETPQWHTNPEGLANAAVHYREILPNRPLDTEWDRAHFGEAAHTMVRNINYYWKHDPASAQTFIKDTFQGADMPLPAVKALLWTTLGQEGNIKQGALDSLVSTFLDRLAAVSPEEASAKVRKLDARYLSSTLELGTTAQAALKRCLSRLKAQL